MQGSMRSTVDDFGRHEAEARRRGLIPISGGDGEGDAAPPAAEDKPAPPTFVPTDDFKQYQETMNGTLRGISDAVASIAARLVPAAASAPGVKDEEIEEALRTGTGAQVLRRAIDEGVNARMTREVNPQMQAGLEAIAKLTVSDATRAAGPDGKPRLSYYTKYQKEIDAVVAAASSQNPGLRLDPATYQWAHDIVVGRHINEITAEVTEQANRAGAGSAPQPPTASTRTARQTESGKIPTVEDLFGRDAADALEFRGITPDQHAQKLGYKDWAAYVAVEMEQRSDVIAEGKK